MFMSLCAHDLVWNSVLRSSLTMTKKTNSLSIPMANHIRSFDHHNDLFYAVHLLYTCVVMV